MRKRGFTLVELCIVISIITIVASLLLPIYMRSRGTAIRSVCANNLMQIGTALHMYAQSYNGRFPREDNEFAPLYPFMQSTDIWWCPSDPFKTDWDMKQVKKPSSPGVSPEVELVPVRTFSSYAYKGGLMNDDLPDTAIASEARAWHDDLVNFLYVDGHVKGCPVQGFKPVVKPRREWEKENRPRAEPALTAPLSGG